MRDGEDPRDIHWRKTRRRSASWSCASARARRGRTSRSPLDVAAARRRRATSGTTRFERRIRDVASRAVAHVKRGDRVAVVTNAGGAARADRSAGADPLLRYLALVESVPEARRSRERRPPRAASPPSGARPRVRFGLVHRVMTDALAALGVLAVVSTASLSPLDERRPPRRASRSPSRSRRAGRAQPVAAPLRDRRARSRSSSSRGRGSLRRALRRSTSPSSSPRCSRSSASRPGAARRTTSRSSSSRSSTSSPARCSAAGSPTGSASSASSSSRPGALVLSHLRREVEGNYRQGARDRTGLPVDVPRILRSRRVVGRRFLAATCLLSVPIFLFTATLFVLFPRVGLSLLLLNHPHAGRMVGFSDHVDLGEVGVLRDDPTIALRFDGRRPRPTRRPPRMTLRLRGTAFDAYDGRAWERTHRATTRPARPRATDALSDLRATRTPTRDRKVVVRPRAHRSARSSSCRRAPSRCASAPQGQVAARRAAHDLQQGPEDELRYAGSDARGLRYDVFLAGDSEEPRRAAARGPSAPLPRRSRRPPRRASPTSPTRGPTRSRRPPQKANAIEDHLRKEYRYDLNSPLGRRQAAARRLPLRVPARALRVLLDRDGDDAARRSASRRAT